MDNKLLKKFKALRKLSVRYCRHKALSSAILSAELALRYDNENDFKREVQEMSNIIADLKNVD